MIRSSESQSIYKTLMAGEVINKHIPNGHSSGLVSNPMYESIVNDQDDYEALYQNIGFKLVAIDGAFYLKDIRELEGQRDASMEMQVIIEAIAIGMYKNHIPKSRLLDFNLGLPDSFIGACLEDSEISDLLSECGIKEDFDKAINNKLLSRKIAYLNGGKRLVLSESGRAVFNALYPDS